MIRIQQIAAFILVFGMAQNCFYHHHTTIIITTIPLISREKEELIMAAPLLKEIKDLDSSSKEEQIVTTTVVAQPMESGFGAGGSGMFHLLHDGVLESPYLQFATDNNMMKENTKEARASRSNNLHQLKVISPPSLASANGPWVYVLDNRRLNQLMGPQWCAMAVKNLQNTIKLLLPEQQQHADGEQSNDTMLLWPRLPDRVVLMHLHDSPEFLPCPPLYNNEKLNVQYHQRSVAVGRHWNASELFVDPGTLTLHQTVIDKNKSKTFTRQHCPMSVRTDMVAALAQVLSQNHYNNATLADPLHLWSRLVHVTYHWEEDSINKNKPPSSLRSMVLQHLREVQEQHPEWNMTLGLVGKRDKAGRRSAQKEYIENMLSAKIIVLAQRNGWEDHLRLMEAMITGALVMTDPMLAMPFGLVDGESIVVYRSLEELTARLKFYLNPRHAIQRKNVAAKGRFVAMSQHRSFHHAERILLGRVRTVCSTPLDYSQDYNNEINHGATNQSSLSACPYVIHASEFG